MLDPQLLLGGERDSKQTCTLFQMSAAVVKFVHSCCTNRLGNNMTS